MKDFSQIKWLLDGRLLYSLDGDDPPSNYVSAFVQPGRLCSSPVPEMIAAEIVRRWNAHKDLLSACETLMFELSAGPSDKETRDAVLAAARAAIAKARGGK